MQKIINKINSDEILQEANRILQLAFSSNNMGLKYHLFHEANDLKRIAKIIWKYEEMKSRGDL